MAEAEMAQPTDLFTITVHAAVALFEWGERVRLAIPVPEHEYDFEYCGDAILGGLHTVQVAVPTYAGRYWR